MHLLGSRTCGGAPSRRDQCCG